MWKHLRDGRTGIGRPKNQSNKEPGCRAESPAFFYWAGVSGEETKAPKSWTNM